MNDPAPQTKTEPSISKRELQELTDILGEIAYGSVTVIIQNGRIVQIEKNEKLRLK